MFMHSWMVFHCYSVPIQRSRRVRQFSEELIRESTFKMQEASGRYYWTPFPPIFFHFRDGSISNGMAPVICTPSVFSLFALLFGSMLLFFFFGCVLCSWLKNYLMPERILLFVCCGVASLREPLKKENQLWFGIVENLLHSLASMYMKQPCTYFILEYCGSQSMTW